MLLTVFQLHSLHWISLGLNVGLHGEGPATNLLSKRTAVGVDVTGVGTQLNKSVNLCTDNAFYPI